MIVFKVIVKNSSPPLTVSQLSANSQPTVSGGSCSSQVPVINNARYLMFLCHHSICKKFLCTVLLSLFLLNSPPSHLKEEKKMLKPTKHKYHWKRMKTNLLVMKSPKAVRSVSAQSNVQEAFLSNLSRLYVCFVIHVIFQNQGIYRTSATSNFILYLSFTSRHLLFPILHAESDISFTLCNKGNQRCMNVG